MITKVLEWFSPTRWAILGGVALAVIAAQTGFYFWAKGNGYDAREAELQSAVAEQRAKNAKFDIERAVSGANTARKVDQLNSATTRKVANEKAKPLPTAASAQCVSDNAGGGVSGVPATGSSADACAAATDLAKQYRNQSADNAGIAEQNADQVTALQNHIESSRREYNKTTGNKDDRPVSDAEKRFEARTKNFEKRAERLEKPQKE
jgi:hypothetical protein